MCEISAALAIASSVAGFAAQSQAVDAQNAAAAAAHQNAGLAATRKYEAEQQNVISEARSAREQGYDAAMKARESQGVAKASAGSSGIDLSSLSVDDIINAERQKAAINADRIQNKIDDTKSQYVFNTKAYEQEAQGRIDANPFQAPPSPLGLAIELVGAGFKGYKSNPSLSLSNIG